MTVNHWPLGSTSPGRMAASFMSGPGLDLAGKHERKTMIRKKWSGGEPVLSVETEDEFWKAVSTGEAVEDLGATLNTYKANTLKQVVQNK